MALKGRCLCESVRYEVVGELPPLVNCHCQFCRRAHGAAFVTVAWVPRSAFRFISGEELFHSYEAKGGFRGFCSCCGTRLFNGLTSGDGFITLIISTLDEDLPTTPVMHINVESKAQWYSIDDDLPQYQTRPADVTATLKSLRGPR